MTPLFGNILFLHLSIYCNKRRPTETWKEISALCVYCNCEGKECSVLLIYIVLLFLFLFKRIIIIIIMHNVG